jgi:hypothetical protein
MDQENHDNKLRSGRDARIPIPIPTNCKIGGFGWNRELELGEVGRSRSWNRSELVGIGMKNGDHRTPRWYEIY